MNTENPTPEPNKEHKKLIVACYIGPTLNRLPNVISIDQYKELPDDFKDRFKPLYTEDQLSLAAQGAREEQYFKNLLAVINDDTLTENGKITAIELSLQQRIKFAAQGATPPQPVIPRATMMDVYDIARKDDEANGPALQVVWSSDAAIVVAKIINKYLDQHTTPPDELVEKIVSAVINVGDIEDDQNGNITTEININELRAAITKILKP